MIAQAIAPSVPMGSLKLKKEKPRNHIGLCEGMSFDKGWLSPYFMTDPKGAECVLEDARVLIHEKKISNLADLLPC